LTRNLVDSGTQGARQAKNKDLEADAFEIRKCAERRLGEMIMEQPKAQGVQPGAT
jgi:hypothetical protein